MTCHLGSHSLAGVLDREADEDSLAFALVEGDNGRVWESLLMLSRWRQEHFKETTLKINHCRLIVQM